MNKEISINLFDSSSIEKAIKDIEKYENDIKDKTDSFVQRLVDIGIDVITTKMSSAYVDGPLDVNVNVIKNGLGSITISVEGKTVLFIEFGTGINKSDSPEARANLIEGNVLKHGEYGLKKGANPKGWYYKYNNFTRKTYGIDALTPVYSSKKEMEQQVVKIAKEVFGR